MPMKSDGFQEEPLWDEYQWEFHLNEIEKKSEQLRKFITSDPFSNRPRWVSLIEENRDKSDAVDAYIEEELLLDEAYYPEDDEWEDEDEADEDDGFFFKDSESSDQDLSYAEDEDEDEDFESGEEWKSLSEEYAMSNSGSLENLPVYMQTRQFTIDLLHWADAQDRMTLPDTVHDLVEASLRIGAKLAGGYSFGFDPDLIGGNIAYTKKALHSANHALIRLQELKKSGLLSPSEYAAFHGELFEIRNDIGIYVQRLREKFRFGVE